MTRIIAFITGLLLIMSCNSTHLTRQVQYNNINTVAALYKAVNLAKPGDRIVLEDGMYADVKLIIQRSGEVNKPIHIKAENPGKVIFSGDAKVELRGSYIILEGIYFKDGNRNINEWKTHGPGLVAIYGSHNRITQCVFDNFDEANSAWITTSLTADGIVPQYCRIDHCSFINKLTFDQVINLNNTVKASFDSTAGGPPMYHRIDHNFFSNPPKPGNAGGGIRVGYYRYDTGRCIIDSNLFMRQDSEPEIITSKSQQNIYYANTFLNCQGTLNFRHGDGQMAVNNFFIGTDKKFGYGGMFVWGSGHIIASNYFELSRTLDARGNASLYLNPGATATEHALAHDILIANNRFVIKDGYAIHFNPLEKQRKAQCEKNGWLYQTPKNIRLLNNIFFRDILLPNSLFHFNEADSNNYVWKNNSCNYKHLNDPMELKLTYTPCTLVVKNPDYNLQNCNSYGLHLIDTVPAYFKWNRNIESILQSGITGKPLTADEVGASWFRQIPSYAVSGTLPAELAEKRKRIISRSK